MQTASAASSPIPLCVDLDGTLIRSDVLWESFMILLKRNPLFLFAVPFWFLRGRAVLKQEIAARVELNAAHLPYHESFLAYLRAEKKSGRILVLATASDHRLAQAVAHHLGIFSEVLASDGKTNLRGRNKGATLSARFGKKQFDYAGNSTVDLPVWAESKNAIVVNASEGLVRRARERTDVSYTFNDRYSTLRLMIKALRPHQWVKNLIIAVPLLTSHQLANFYLVKLALLAMLAFSFCASGVYVLNDLLDLESDRQHATKKFRPFASGRLHLPIGFALVGLTLSISVIASLFLPVQFCGVLAFYFLLTASYSWRIKQMALLDVFCLAGLYTIRLVAGHAATGIRYSFWLLAFSIFIFLSLALVKRFTELHSLRLQNKIATKGRGYTVADAEPIAMLGIASGFMAILVMALYVNSPEVSLLYFHQNRLLLVCPLMLFWISRIWLISYRGQMHDDPIVFALKDRGSYLIGALVVVILWLATGQPH